MKNTDTVLRASTSGFNVLVTGHDGCGCRTPHSKPTKCLFEYANIKRFGTDGIGAGGFNEHCTVSSASIVTSGSLSAVPLYRYNNYPIQLFHPSSAIASPITRHSPRSTILHVFTSGSRGARCGDGGRLSFYSVIACHCIGES